MCIHIIYLYISWRCALSTLAVWCCVPWDQGEAPTAWPRACPNKSYTTLPIHLDIKADVVKEGRGGCDEVGWLRMTR